MEQKTSQPAILFPGFDNTEASFSAASELQEKGYPILIVTASGNIAAMEAARSAGYIVVEAEREDALRAGLQYFVDSMPGLPGVVTVDRTEGYSVEDILRVAGAMDGAPDRIVLASRRDAPHIGLLSRLERFAARFIFLAVHGRRVRDPWAGLRGIPAEHVPALLALKGSGYRYEFNIVLNLQHLGIKAVSTPVDAAYSLSDGSGFRERALDILRILFLPLRFVSASLVSTLVDNAMFLLFGYVLTQNQPELTIVIARFSGAVTGYLLNRSVVFKHKYDDWRQELRRASKFALLAACNTLIAIFLIPFISKQFGLYMIISKQIGDIILFVFSFLIQRDVVFKKKS